MQNQTWQLVGYLSGELVGLNLSGACPVYLSGSYFAGIWEIIFITHIGKIYDVPTDQISQLITKYKTGFNRTQRREEFVRKDKRYPARCFQRTEARYSATFCKYGIRLSYASADRQRFLMFTINQPDRIWGLFADIPTDNDLNFFESLIGFEKSCDLRFPLLPLLLQTSQAFVCLPR